MVQVIVCNLVFSMVVDVSKLSIPNPDQNQSTPSCWISEVALTVTKTLQLNPAIYWTVIPPTFLPIWVFPLSISSVASVEGGGEGDWEPEIRPPSDVTDGPWHPPAMKFLSDHTLPFVHKELLSCKQMYQLQEHVIYWNTLTLWDASLDTFGSVFASEINGFTKFASTGGLWRHTGSTSLDWGGSETSCFPVKCIWFALDTSALL